MSEQGPVTRLIEAARAFYESYGREWYCGPGPDDPDWPRTEADLRRLFAERAAQEFPSQKPGDLDESDRIWLAVGDALAACEGIEERSEWACLLDDIRHSGPCQLRCWIATTPWRDADG